MKKGDYRIILTVILSLCFLLINKNYINAESEDWTVSLSEIGSGWGYVLNNGSNYTKDTFIQFFNLKNKNTGKTLPVFCIQNGVGTEEGLTYAGKNSTDYYSGLSEDVKRRINYAGNWYYTYHNGKSDSTESRVGTQYYIWSIINPVALPIITTDPGYINWSIAETLSENKELFKKSKAKYEEVKNYVDQKMAGSNDLNFKNQLDSVIELRPGQTREFTDYNNVLSTEEYKVDTSSLPAGVNAYKNGNKLVISVDKNFKGVFDGTVNIITNHPKLVEDGNQFYVFSSSKYMDLTWWKNHEAQQMFYPGKVQNPDNKSLKLKVITGKIALKKLDGETGVVAQGDAVLKGAVYAIYNSTGNEIARLTIGDDLTAKTDYLPLGTYTIKEVGAPTGYNLSNETYTVTITADNLNPVVQVKDNVIKGNLEILKKLESTDYDSEINLSGAQFKITLKSDTTKVYYTNESGLDGICRVDNLPYGQYIVEEVTVPNSAFKVDNFEITISEDSRTYERTIVDKSKKMKIAVEKILLPEVVGKTDAKVSGAYFTVYTDEAATVPYKDKNGSVVVIGPTNKDGYAVSKTMRTGSYYLKETTFPEGINPDAMVLGENVTYKEKIYKAVEDNTNQTDETLTLTIDGIVNVPKMGSLDVIKYNNDPDSTEEVASKGAILGLALKSNPDEILYKATIDENGHAEFINEDLKVLGYKYTIPYGEYVLTEVKESKPEEHTSFYIQAEEVNIVEEEQKEYRILSDEPVPAWLKVVKKDKVTGNEISLEGAKFKIWDVTNKKWVEQMITPSGEYISEFETNADGYFYTPQKLQPGKYVLYETQAPKGYYLEESLRVPEDEKDLGNAKVSGEEFEVNKVTTGVKDETTYPKDGIKTGDLVLEKEIKDQPLMGKIEIKKTGEKLTGATTTEGVYKTEDEKEVKLERYIPNYTQVGLEGTKYEIVATKDIKSPDGKAIYVHEGEVVDRITTGKDGIATTKDLYLGEYEIKEVETPRGYLKDENIPNVIVENDNQYVESATIKKELTDVRQKLELTFKKTFEQIKYSTQEEPKIKAVFGIYTKNAIMSYDNKNVVIPANKLVDIIEVTKDDNVTSTIDLPEGTYYAKELYVTYPYTLDTNLQEFTLKYNGNNKQEFVIEKGKDVVNKTETTSLTLIKLSSTTIGNVVLNGDKLDKTNLDQEIQKIISDLKGKTEEEIRNYFKEKNIKAVGGAKYRLYTDEACTKELLVKNELTGKFEAVELVTDETGIIKLENLPLGEYWIKEIEAPQGYELSKDAIKVTLDVANKNSIVYQALIEETVKSAFITKTDIFTGEVVPNCTFEIKDEDGNTLLYSKTDEKGDAYIPVDLFEDGKTYTYTEIEAPEIYKLNEEPHEFTAKFDKDGNWAVEKIKVENVRKESRVELTKLDMVDSTPIPNCKFELKSLETDFKVEGVTDENGVYVFEDIPYGKYTYTELEAPEEYLIDTTPHEITIDAEDIKIVVKDERAPETGDIAVASMTALAIASVCGIVITLKKKYVKQ